ncbi:MAG: NAD-dependent deacetylase [Sterolibacteriaceae bacterium]|nr:NAD-dependent deacetylase [Sterolibacteriaceae bacterium]
MTESSTSQTARYRRVARTLAQADGLLIAAGAGMGVDSGLPDFRGTSGFWRAYPALGLTGLRFEQIASPHAFRADARLAWGFYGHRLQLYRRTVPHAGFAILTAIAERLPRGAAVFTSNVDGQFQRAGFAAETVAECHGSIHWLQCAGPCCSQIWPADELDPVVDEPNCRMQSDLPSCARCGELARPNILMFGDDAWLARRSDEQKRRLDIWMSRSPRLVTIELGAGTAIPTVRLFGEQAGGPLIRFNPTEPWVEPGRGEGFAVGALEGLRRLADALRESGFLDGQD